MADPATRVRSALFTPGTEAARLRKAVTSGADVCIFDLEDSVPADRVAEARQIIREAIDELAGGGRIWVRVHPASSREMAHDLDALPLGKIQAIMVPKVDDVDDLHACRAAIASAKGPADLPLVAMVESAAAVVNCPDIARARGLFCLASGRFDLSAELGIDPDSDSAALLMARGAVVLASAAARLHPPLDSPWVKIHDMDGLRAAAEQGRRDGFAGMLLIHPSHVETVNRVFTPTREEVAWARNIMAAAMDADAQGRGAFASDGQMVDEAIVRRARAILRDAGA